MKKSIQCANEKKSPPNLTPKTPSHARIPDSDEHTRRSRRAQAPSAQTASTVDRSLIDTSFRASERLRLTARFDAIRRRGSWVRGQWVSVGILQNSGGVNRVGVRVQRGVKKATTRNRSKRVFRSVYRLNKHRLRPGFDIIVVLLKTGCPPFDSLQEDFFRACKRLDITF